MKIVKKSDKAVVYLDESITIINASELKKDLKSLLDEGISTIIVDFTKTKSIDACGIGKILMFQKLFKERSGCLKVVNINNEISRLFKITGINDVLAKVSNGG